MCFACILLYALLAKLRIYYKLCIYNMFLFIYIYINSRDEEDGRYAHARTHLCVGDVYLHVIN